MGIRLRLLLAIILLAGIGSITAAQEKAWYWADRLGAGKALLAVWHPTAAIFAIASDTGVRFYDLSLREVGAILGDQVTELAWSADGHWLATANDEQVRIWQVEDIAHPAFDTAIPQSMAPVAFSPDGTHLAYTVGGRAIRIRDMATGRSTLAFDGHRASSTDAAYQPPAISELVWSPDGTTIASVGSDLLLVWNAATGAIQHTVKDFSGISEYTMRAIFNIQWVGQQLWAVDVDSDQLYIIEGDQLLHESASNMPPDYDGRFSPDGRLLAQTFYQYITLSRRTGHDFVVLKSQHYSGDDDYGLGEGDGFTAWSPDGRYLVAGSLATVTLWRVANDQLEHMGIITDYNGTLTSLDFSPDGSQLAAGYGQLFNYRIDGRLRIWDVQARQLVWRSEWAVGTTSSVDWSADGNYIATGSSEEDCVARIWDAQTHAVTECLESSDYDGQVRWRPHNTELAVVAGSVLFIFDSLTLPTIEEAQPYTFPDGDTVPRIDSFDWSPDGTAIVSDSYLGQAANLAVWRVADGELLAELENSDVFARDAQGYSSPYSHVRFSPDGRWIAVAEGNVNADPRSRFNATIAIYDAATGKLHQTLTGHQRGVTALDWSPDSRYLLSGGLDGTARLWDMAQPDQSQILPIEATNRIAAVAWSPVEDLIAVGSQSGMIYLVTR